MKCSKSKMLVCSTIILTFIYLIWRAIFTLPKGYGKVAMAFGVILLLAEVFGMLEQMIHFTNMTDLHRPYKPKVRSGQYPTVDVFIATYNEPVSLLYKTVNACTNMKYPDKEKVNIYLCDDGNRHEVRELAEKFRIHYLAREEHSGAKAGNLNHAMANSNGELIVTFDADMIPMSSFLLECVPYFMEESKRAGQNEGDGELEKWVMRRKDPIGFVQTPQSFYNLDLFQYYLHSEHNIPNEQDYFYRDIQLAKNRSNSVIYGGSNTMISRAALEEVGGFVTNVITEDFATGLLIQSKGYQCIATDEVLASGLSPEDLKNLVKQRKRWARGCIQTGRKFNILFRKGITMKQKISYMVSIAYWYDSIKRFIYVMAPIMYSVFGITIFVAGPLELLIFWLPMYWVNSVTIKWLSGNIRTLQWTNIYETIMFPFLLKDVILEMVGISEKKFRVTQKGEGNEDKKYHFKVAIPHMVLTTLTLIGTIRCIYVIFATGNVSISFLFFWLLINLYNLTMALFFMLGRKSFRKSERLPIMADCVIEKEDGDIEGKTFDISDGGFSVILNKPYYIDPEKEFSCRISDLGYEASFWAKIVQIVRTGESWKYACSISNIEEEEYRKLLHILHDRVPPLTKQVRTEVGFFDNLRINFVKRTGQKLQFFNRKLPRVMMEKEIISKEGIVVLKSFDYWFVSLEEKRVKYGKNKRRLKISDDIVLELEYERELHYYDRELSLDKQISLYRIKNREEVEGNEKVLDLLVSLDDEYRKRLLEERGRYKADEVEEFDELALL